MDSKNQFQFCEKEDYYPKDSEAVSWIDYRNLKIKSMAAYPVRTKLPMWPIRGVKLYLKLETEKGKNLTCVVTFDGQSTDGDWCDSSDRDINFKRLAAVLNTEKTICLEARNSEFSENLFIGKIYYID